MSNELIKINIKETVNYERGWNKFLNSLEYQNCYEILTKKGIRSELIEALLQQVFHFTWHLKKE